MVHIRTFGTPSSVNILETSLRMENSWIAKKLAWNISAVMLSILLRMIVYFDLVQYQSQSPNGINGVTKVTAFENNYICINFFTMKYKNIVLP